MSVLKTDQVTQVKVQNLQNPVTPANLANLPKMKIKYLSLDTNHIIIKKDNDIAIIAEEEIFCMNNNDLIKFFQNIPHYILDMDQIGKINSKFPIYIGKYLNKSYIFLSDYSLLINFYHSAEELSTIITKFEVQKILLLTDELFISPTEIFISTILN